MKDPVQVKGRGLYVNRLSDSVKIRADRRLGLQPEGEQDAGTEEIWEQGGRKVSELSRIFEELKGGSDKISFHNSLSRPESEGSSRPASVYSSIPPSDTCSRASSLPPSSPRFRPGASSSQQIKSKKVNNSITNTVACRLSV